MNKILKEKIKNLNYQIIEAKDYIKSRDLALELSKEFPENIEIKNSLISIYISLNNTEEAFKIIQELLSSSNANVMTFYFLSEIYRKNNDPKNRIKAIINGLKLKKDYQPLLLAFYSSLINYENKSDLPFQDEIFEVCNYIIDENLIEINDIKIISQQLIVNKFLEVDGIDNNLISNKEIVKDDKRHLKGLIKKILDIINDDHLNNILRKTIITNLKLETIIISLKCFLINIYNAGLLIKEENKANRFSESLAIQNIIKGHIWMALENEKEIIKKFKSTVIRKIKNHEKLDNFELLNFYSTLEMPEDENIEKEIFKRLDKKNNDLIKSAQKIYHWENIYKKNKRNIKSNTNELNNYEKKIELFYNKNPLPTWDKVNIENKIKFKDFLVSEIYPMQIYDFKDFDSEYLNILDIGCGNGRDSILLSSIENSKITAIDLSLRNLTYSYTKARQNNVKNISFQHKSLLNIKNSFDKKFHFINVINVLEELENYDDGLKEITNIIEKNGFIRFGIESKINHQIFENSIELINSALKIESMNNKSIAEIRSLVRISENKDIKKIGLSHNFNDKNSFINFFSPLKNPNFDIPKIINMLKENNLQFVGWSKFVNNRDTKNQIFSLYKETFSDDIFFRNLNNWNKLEQTYKSLFSNKYCFWAKKI